MRQGTRQALRVIKERVRANAFGYTDEAFEEMVDAWLYEEDVKRAVATAHLAGVFRSESGGTGYILQGFGMDEEPVEIHCRPDRPRVLISRVARL